LRLEVVDRGRPRTPRAFVARVVRGVLQHVDRADLAVSLLLTDDAEIARLHAQFLGDARPTDVLSFPSDDGVELVVSVETAGRVARELGHSQRAELALYIVHGLLHCCGFDDVRARARARMRAAERAVLRTLALACAAVDEARRVHRPAHRAK
jgi:probable rRNA maturation factor